MLRGEVERCAGDLPANAIAHERDLIGHRAAFRSGGIHIDLRGGKVVYLAHDLG